MYKYKTTKTGCLRFVFSDGRQVNLLGNDTKISLPATRRSPAKKIDIPGATSKDFEEILNDPRYASMHSKIIKVKTKKDVPDKDSNIKSKSDS